MKKFIVLFLLTGCGYSSEPFTPEACTVEKIDKVTTIKCPGGSTTTITDGVDGETGPIGLTGSMGIAGAVGPQGPNGTPGTVVGVVQFCPGVPTYPSIFPEYGIIIAGQLYAVYSANGGFLALIPSGTYNSNAIGNSCTFTVNPDGTVTN